MNKAAFAEVTVTEYVAMFDEAVHHWDKPFGVTMSPSDWNFFLFGTRPQTPPSGQHPPLQATFPCGGVVSDLAELRGLLQMTDVTANMKTSDVLTATFEIPCATLDFQTRAVGLWPLPVLAHWLRARGSAAPTYWSRGAHEAQVHLLQGQRLRELERRAVRMSEAAAVVNDPAATAEARADAAVDLQTAAARMGADDTILSTSFFLNQFYNKLLRHAFLPELTGFDNTAKLRSFCAADYAAIQRMLVIIKPAVTAEQNAAGDKLSATNTARADDLVTAGYIHLSFFRFQDTTLFTETGPPNGVRCIIVRASVIASCNSCHYVCRILFTQTAGTNEWHATKELKNCQCVSGSELEALWCTHMAGCSSHSPSWCATASARWRG